MNHFKDQLNQHLPSCAPFLCPECKNPNRDKITILRHYAFGHKKVFDLVDQEDFKPREKEEVFEGDFLTDILPKSKPRNKKDVKSPSKPQTPRIPVKKLLVPEKVLWTGENTIFKPHWDSLILIPQFLNIKKVGIYKTFWQSSSLKSSAIPTELSSLVIDLSNILLYLLIHH